MTIEELVGRCKASVHLDVNQHKAYYQKLDEYLNEHERKNDIDPKELEAMLAADTMYELQFYPSTPVGFYVVYGLTLESVLAQAEKCLTK